MNWDLKKRIASTIKKNIISTVDEKYVKLPCNCYRKKLVWGKSKKEAFFRLFSHHYIQE